MTRLPEHYLDEARLRANRFVANWDAGTAGSLAADVRRLLWEREALVAELEQASRREPPRIVGFAGYAGSGKNVAAEALGGVVLGFADPLYAALAAMLGVSEASLRARATKELPMACGKSPRDLLRTLGTEWGRQLVREDLWVWRARQRIEEAAATGAAVIAVCDVRFPNEAAFLRGLGGQIWWVDRPGMAQGEHASDRALTAADADRVIRNDGSLEQLRWKVEAELRAWGTGRAAAGNPDPSASL